MRGQVTEIYKVFESANKKLVVPVYQRNYDWRVEHCSVLLEDLAEIAETKKKHFFGAIVGDPEDSWTWTIIDGQQRLTTVSILMLAVGGLPRFRYRRSVTRKLGERHSSWLPSR